ncbi:hypothetical protein [Streptomyces sp. CAI-85]|uniref:hypothetical protein n=1 Tax=Streptomyces sp. CAI-85 TaxID=1472662 RepID=UPI001587D5F6|nr:hypothetical protein [Streptomyces sp. CAI-85]NUV58939.1 hypothetical protein [Streptomyces sp. CAI-85]
MSDEKTPTEAVPATDTADAQPADADAGTQGTDARTGDAQPEDGAVTTLDHYMPAPPALGRDGK